MAFVCTYRIQWAYGECHHGLTHFGHHLQVSQLQIQRCKPDTPFQVVLAACILPTTTLARMLTSLAIKFKRHTSTWHDDSFSSPYMLVVTTSLKNIHSPGSAIMSTCLVSHMTFIRPCFFLVLNEITTS